MDKKINWSDAIEFEKEKINKGFFEYLFTDINEFKLEKEKFFLLKDLKQLDKVQIYRLINQTLPGRKRNIERFEMNLIETIKYLLDNPELDGDILEMLLYIQEIYTIFKLSQKMGEYTFQIEEYKEENKKLSEELKKYNEFKKTFYSLKREVFNYKFDLIGIIAGALSIFTVFGVNYSILTESFAKAINDNPVKLFLMWFIFNTGLLFLIRGMFSTIKEYFGTNNQDFELEKDSEEKTKKGIISAILENKNIKLLILILFLLSLLLTFGKLV